MTCGHVTNATRRPSSG